MSLSKSGCSNSITKSDLKESYLQGFTEGHNATLDITNNKIKELRNRIDEISLSRLSSTIYKGNYILREDVMEAIEDIFGLLN